jgi:hypothetical protein
VFGALVKQHVLKQTAQQADWLVGAGLFKETVKARALRSMAEPGTAYDDPVLGKDPQPAHMKDIVVTRQDNGGVHINSGIPNRAFYLAATAIERPGVGDGRAHLVRHRVRPPVEAGRGFRRLRRTDRERRRQALQAPAARRTRRSSPHGTPWESPHHDPAAAPE